MAMTRKRMEENGLYISSAEHWELIEDKVIYIYIYKHCTLATIHIPMDIIRHLGLKHKDKITIAIRHKEVKQK